MARRRPPTVHGIAVVDKPAGVTSHDVVAQLRRRFDERRVGHAGTLDPGATGVLVVGVGMVTRLLRFVTEGRKRYTGEIVVGIETDTLDADGVVTATHERSRRRSRCGPLGDRRASARRHRADPTDGVGGARSAGSGCTSSPAKGLRSNERHGRFALTASTSSARTLTPTVARCCWSRWTVAPVRTYAPWPPTSVTCSVPAPICATCGAPPSSRSRSTRRRRPDTCVLLPPIEAVRALSKVTVDVDGEAAIAVGKPLPSPPGRAVGDGHGRK